jgi:hypothetical protein
MRMDVWSLTKIVGSTNSASPTAADHWLLKRTWKEMKTMRGW